MRARKIFLADDSGEFRSLVTDALGLRFEVVCAETEAAFREVFRPYSFDLVLLDLRLDREREGLGLLREVMAADALQPVIMVSAYGDSEAILDATEAGALMFLHKKEFSPELLGRMVDAVLEQARMRRQVAALEARLQVEDPLSLTSGNPLVKAAAKGVERAANDPDAVVLLTGATGAGLDLAAQGIHARSSRRSPAPLVTCNGAFLSPTEQMGRFFGMESGAGMAKRKGMMEEAQWGVLFIDHFGDLQEKVQASILQVVGTRQRESNPAVQVDVQLIVGTPPETAPSLRTLMERHFPATRLVEIHLPALHQRMEDLPLLATYFLQQMRAHGRTGAQSLDPAVLHALANHSWPGNLHELRATIEFAGVRAAVEDSDTIEPPHLPESFRNGGASRLSGEDGFNINRHLAQVEARVVEEAIRAHPKLNKTELAARLGYNDRFTLGRRMRRILAEFPEIGKEATKVARWYE